MQEIEGLRIEVHGLGIELAGLRPLVHEVHANIPKIGTALETLARVSEKLETNADAHKRIHARISFHEKANADSYGMINGRISDNESSITGLERRFSALREEYLVCMTTDKIRKDGEKDSFGLRLKRLATEKMLELGIAAVMFFLLLIIIDYLSRYPGTAKVISG